MRYQKQILDTAKPNDIVITLLACVGYCTSQKISHVPIKCFVGPPAPMMSRTWPGTELLRSSACE